MSRSDKSVSQLAREHVTVLTKREHFAALAMQVASQHFVSHEHEAATKWAVERADYLLRALAASNG